MKKIILFISLFCSLAFSITPLEYINEHRTNVGMIPFSENNLLNKSAYNHAKYLAKNKISGHTESNSKPFYTGFEPNDRAYYVNYNAPIGENLTVGFDSYKSSIDGLFTAIYHRFGFFNFADDEIGIGMESSDDNTLESRVYNLGNTNLLNLCNGSSYLGEGTYYYKVCKNQELRIEETILDNALKSNALKNPDIILWPYENQQNFQPVFYEESPDPLPTCSVSGNPISVQFNDHKAGSISMNSFKLFDENNIEITDTKILNENTDPNNRFTNKEFALFPMKRLEWNKNYSVEFKYKEDGISKNKYWNFKTESLSIPYYKLLNNNVELNVKSGKEYAIYVPPVNCNDNRYSYNYNYSSSLKILKNDSIDANTLVFKLEGNIGDILNINMDNGKKFTLVISTFDDAIGNELDTDKDGMPDDDDLDDDNDGVNDLEDSYPLDNNCFRSIDGDGSQCYISALKNLDFKNIFFDNGIFIFVDTLNENVIRYNYTTKTFIDKTIINKNNIGSIESYFYDKNDDILYLGYSTGQITKIDFKTNEKLEIDFSSIIGKAGGIISVGNYILVQENGHSWITHSIFNKLGVLVDSDRLSSTSKYFSWDNINNKVYSLSNFSPKDLYFKKINQLTGKIDSKGDSPYHGDYEIKGPIFVSKDGSKILLGSGDIYNESDLTLFKSVAGKVEIAYWDDEKLAYAYSIDNKTVLKIKDNDLKDINTKYYDGKALFIEKINNKYIIVTFDNKLIFNEYDINEVAIEDDIDNNINKNTCYECLLKNIDTKNIFMNDGIYIFVDTINSQVVRYDYNRKEFIDLVRIKNGLEYKDINIKSFDYSKLDNALYIGYSNGNITKIDFKKDKFKEENFATTSMSTNGLSVVGSFILAQDSSGGRYTHYIFDTNGILKDSKDSNRYSKFYAWNNINDKVYFFRDGTSPNDLNFEKINQSTGNINEEGESPYHGDYVIKGPIIISKDGKKILLGSGDIYNSNSLEVINSLSISIETAIWRNNGGLIYSIGNNLKRLNSSYSLEDTNIYSGNIININSVDKKYIVIVSTSSKLEFHEYTYNGIENEFLKDTDNDGIPDEYENIYGLNPNINDASLDKDNDGKTNLEEFVDKTNPSDKNSKNYTLGLIQGWNLISLPFNTTLNTSDINDNNIEVIRSLQNEKWLVWSNSISINESEKLLSLEDGYGYWIKSKQNTILNLKANGLSASSSVNINKWSMLGSKQIDNIDTFFSENPSVKIIWKYKDGQYHAASSDNIIANELAAKNIPLIYVISSNEGFFVK